MVINSAERSNECLFNDFTNENRVWAVVGAIADFTPVIESNPDDAAS